MKKLFLVCALALGLMSFSSKNSDTLSVEDTPTCIELAMIRANQALANGEIGPSQYFHYVNVLMSLCNEY